MSKTFKPRHDSDDHDRAAIGVFLRLTEKQVNALERLANAAGKSLPSYLRDIGEAAIEQVLPAEDEEKDKH